MNIGLQISSHKRIGLMEYRKRTVEHFYENEGLETEAFFKMRSSFEEPFFTVHYATKDRMFPIIFGHQHAEK